VVPVVDGLEEAFQLPHRPAVHHQDVGHPDRGLRPRLILTPPLAGRNRPGPPGWERERDYSFSFSSTLLSQKGKLVLQSGTHKNIKTQSTQGHTTRR
jgi:hypothetical protein